MSDWKDGDLALCIKGGKVNPNEPDADTYPRTGAVYTVRRYGEALFFSGLGEALWFYDAPINTIEERVWDAKRFVKVTPGEEDEFDREVVEAMNSSPYVTVKVLYEFDNPLNKPFEININRRLW